VTPIKILQAQPAEDVQVVQELFWEYLTWANDMNERKFGLRLDIAKMLEEDMANLGKFMPPHGRLLLAQSNGFTAGCVCLKKLNSSIGEVKRLYVKPAFRGRRIGKMLVGKLLEESREIGYRIIRLDSTRYMVNAHDVYRSFGFQEIAPYPESEIPKEYHAHWIFMELSLTNR
jgi:ribosomal protein S18 acetylase RimI-like enzyme